VLPVARQQLPTPATLNELDWKPTKPEPHGRDFSILQLQLLVFGMLFLHRRRFEIATWNHPLCLLQWLQQRRIAEAIASPTRPYPDCQRSIAKRSTTIRTRFFRIARYSHYSLFREAIG
jgi:hypothetical protein